MEKDLGLTQSMGCGIYIFKKKFNHLPELPGCQLGPALNTKINNLFTNSCSAPRYSMKPSHEQING